MSLQLRRLPRAVLALSVSLFSAPALAADWANTQKRIEQLLAPADAQAPPSWSTAAAAVEALGQSCAELGVKDEFELKECEARLPALQEQARSFLVEERRYRADVSVLLGEFDFDSGRFPLTLVPTINALLYDPTPCDTALVWAGSMAGTLCLFASKPKLVKTNGTVILYGSMPAPASYWTLQTPRPALFTPTMEVDAARALRERVGSQKQRATLEFDWKYVPDDCTGDFELRGDTVQGYCWADIPDVAVTLKP